MLTYKNTRTNRIVNIPEEANTNVDFAGRNKEWGRLKLRLEESKRWQRIITPAVTVPEPAQVDGSDLVASHDEPAQTSVDNVGEPVRRRPGRPPKTTQTEEA